MTYKSENDNLLNYLLENVFFYSWKEDVSEDYKYGLELNITPSCNQKCEYCYLVKHGNDLYPIELRNEDTILHNLDIILNYIIERKFILNCIDLYSGEIWGSDFGIAILNKIYDACVKYHFVDRIMIPSNMTFLLSDSRENQINELIEKFNTVNVYLNFSASIDGEPLDDSIRPFVNSKLNHSREFYDKIFNFCALHGYGFHPMVSATNVDKWIENHKWFFTKFKEYGIEPHYISTLEIRDDNWTGESINNLLKYYDWLIDYELNTVFSGNKKNFANYIFNKSRQFKNYAGIRLFNYGNKISCSIQDSLIIRLGDLAIIPCHRTSYKEFIFGKFKIDNDKIVGVEAQNIELANYIWSVNPNVGHPSCDVCKYKDFCIKGCLGAQFESSRDLFMPCESVCKMQKARLKFLVNKYKQLDLFKELEYISTDLSELIKTIEEESDE